jgi:hypothetical protein
MKGKVDLLSTEKDSKKRIASPVTPNTGTSTGSYSSNASPKKTQDIEGRRKMLE